MSPVQRPQASRLGASALARLVSLASAGSVTLALLLSVHGLSLHEAHNAAGALAAAQVAASNPAS